MLSSRFMVNAVQCMLGYGGRDEGPSRTSVTKIMTISHKCTKPQKLQTRGQPSCYDDVICVQNLCGGDQKGRSSLDPPSRRPSLEGQRRSEGLHVTPRFMYSECAPGTILGMVLLQGRRHTSHATSCREEGLFKGVTMAMSPIMRS